VIESDQMTHELRHSDMFSRVPRAHFRAGEVLLYVSGGYSLNLMKRLEFTGQECSLKNTMQSAGAADKVKSSVMRRNIAAG